VLTSSFFVFWGPVAVVQVPTISFVSDVRGPAWALTLLIIGGFVPSLAALVLALTLEGKTGAGQLLRRSVQFNLGGRWYLAIFAVVLCGTTGQIALNRLLGNDFDFRMFLAQLPSFFPLIVLGPISEELGWRGYLLTKLQRHRSPLAASVLVGVVWALWHLPLFFMNGTSQNELNLPFAGFFFGLIMISIIMIWLHNGTNGSIWTAILFHWLFTYAMQVTSSGVTRSVPYNWLEYSPYVVIAGLVVLVASRVGPRLSFRKASA
jgi:hypothetical protein